MIFFAVLDVSLAVNLCINCSFFYIYLCIQRAVGRSAAEADCYCVVYSVADRDTFNNSCRTLDSLVTLDRHTTPCVLVGNKTDLVRQRQVQQHGTTASYTVWELPEGGGAVEGGEVQSTLNVFNPLSCACLFVLGVRCNPHRSHLQTLAISRCHKNVKNTQFSCQRVGFLKLKMHQNPFTAGLRPGPPLFHPLFLVLLQPDLRHFIRRGCGDYVTR